MVEVKKTKGGKFNFTIDLYSSAVLSAIVSGFLMTQVPSTRLNDERSLFNQILFSTIWDLSYNGKKVNRAFIKYSVNRAEALSIIWLLRDLTAYENIELLNLKSSLHQKLS